MAWKFNPFTSSLDYYEADTDTDTGEVNTASNLSSGGGIEGRSFDSKVGVDLQFRAIKQGSGITLTENANDITIAASETDTIIENRRFLATMSGSRATDYFIENGQDYFDSRARWDQAVRVIFGTNDFNLVLGYLGAAWVAPFACTIKGFTAIGTITTGSHDWEANLLWHDATYPITATRVLFTSLVTSVTSGATDDDTSKLTGTCDQLIDEGDLVLPAVRRDGDTTTESLYGSFSFWFEKFIH